MVDRKAVAAGVAFVVFGLAAGYLVWPLVAPDAPTKKRRGRAAATEQLEHVSEDLAPRAQAPDGAPNVVFVIGCTVRKDQMPPYGGPEHTMPALAEFAAAGVRFDDALATSSWTREASVGLLVGQFAASVGMVEPRARHSERVLPDDLTTLAERFQQQGWATLGVTANPNLNYEFGFGQGFDAYRDTVSEGAFASQNKIHGTEVVREALALVDARTEEQASLPVYLQVVLIDPHTPRKVRPKELAAFAEPGVSKVLREYRALLRRTDTAVATLDQGLAERGITQDNTLWVFVADHGEGLSMPKHHGGGHGKRMYASTVEIPWMLRGPDLEAGRRIGGLASGIDVMPTVMGLVGLPEDESLPGRDWSILVRGRGHATDRDRAYAQSMFLRANVASVWTREVQCQSGYDPNVRQRDRIERACFDRSEDPHFERPIESAGLIEELDRWRGDRLAEGSGSDPEEIEPGDDLDAQLEALGYRE